MRLLDELRQTISEIGLQAHSAVDLSGVISDLQVAVNPPGAMAADDVAELRDALLAARERPRDIDTIVDLTKRIDAMVALVIAYDRAIAAIERSLDVLRGDGARVITRCARGDRVIVGRYAHGDRGIERFVRRSPYHPMTTLDPHLTP